MAGLGGLVEVYLAERCRAGYYKPTTARTVGALLQRFARELGDTSPRQVRRADVETWLASRCVSTGTSRRQFSVLRSFFNWAVATERLSRHPMLGMLPPRQPRTLPRGLSAAAVARLLSGLDARGRLVISLMVQEGLRCAEVCNVQIGDLDLTEGHEALLVHGKGGNERVLPLSDETLGYLRQYLAEHPASAGPLIRSYPGPIYPPGRALSPNYLTAVVAGWMSEAGIKRAAFDGVSAHALRHTCATDLVKSGVHIRDVQAVLGHSSLTATQRYLGWAAPGELREAMGGRRYLIR